MEAAAVSAMDFHALSRRELQALCKRNGVRANMSNAAMADALQGLSSVDGIDKIGTTLCLPTPGRSTMKSAVKAVGEEQQHGSPLPRGRRVSVMSPSAIRMDVEEGDDDLKQDLVKEIVKTPGVALRSTSRRARATPAPLLTPATLRRSSRTAARKASAPVEASNLVEEVSTVKRTTRGASGRSKMMVDLDQEGEVAAATPKAQQEERKAVASDVKCDEPEEQEEEEVTKLLDGDSKEEEREEGDEADSSDVANGSALLSDKSCDDLKVEEVVTVEQVATKPQEGPVAEQAPIGVEKSAPLASMEDSPILGVLSKSESTESLTEKEQADGDDAAEWSPVNEMTDEINPVVEDKEVGAGEEAIKDDGFTVTSETVHSSKQILPADAVEDETSEEYCITDGKEGSADEVPQAAPIEDETSEGELDEEEWTSDDAEASEEIDSSDESDYENDETNEERDSSEVSPDLNQEELVEMLQETAIAEEANEVDSAGDASDDGSDEEAIEDGSAEDDDFSGDLPPEFDNVVVLTDAETESDITLPVLEANQVALVSEELMKEVDSTVGTIKEVTKQSEELQKQLKCEDLHSKSLRQLKTMYKDALNAKEGKKQVAAEGVKRLPLAEVDDNTGVNC